MFDLRVEEAIQQLWVDPWNNDGEKAKRLLEEAVNDGDKDACFFLGRCYLGKEFILPKFGFEENEQLGEKYFNMSIERGSAIGIFGARRLAGFTPRCGSYIQPPFNSLKDVWDEVCHLAEEGEVFCQYMLANSYYYGDCIELLGIPESAVDVSMIRDFQKNAIYLYEMTIEKKLTLGIGNLIDILSSGDYGIGKDPERVQKLIEIGAKLRHPFFECEYAIQLQDTDINKAVDFYQRSIEHGSGRAYYYLGKLYGYNGKIRQDLNEAIYYFKKGIEHDDEDVGCYNLLGEIYYKGGDGIEPDYANAVRCFEKARSLDNEWCASMLGQCYLRGLGTPKNYEAAMREFMLDPDDEWSAVGLGEMYCYGLGVKAKPNLGMREYIIPNLDNERAKEIYADFRPGKTKEARKPLFSMKNELVICTILGLIICSILRTLYINLPVMSAGKDLQSAMSEDLGAKKGAIGTEYVDGIDVLTTYEEVVGSDDVFALSMDNIAYNPIYDDDDDNWCIAFFDGKYIPVKYNSYAESDEYSPIGKLVNEPSGKEEDLKRYTHNDPSEIESDIYIDMDGGMYEKQEAHNAKVSESEWESNSATSESQDRWINSNIIMLAWVPLIFVFHYIGSCVGLFQPIIWRSKKRA